MTDDLPQPADGSSQSELERLRAEVESHRQRELAELRSALADARAEASHYRNEAQRNSDLGHQIYSEGQAQIAALKEKLANVATGTGNGRPTYTR